MSEKETQETEEKTPEETPTEDAKVDNAGGDFTPTSTLLDRADSINQKLEKNLEEARKIAARQEEIAARMIISGRAAAGTPQKTPEDKKQEEIEEEVAKIVDRFKQ